MLGETALTWSPRPCIGPYCMTSSDHWPDMEFSSFLSFWPLLIPVRSPIIRICRGQSSNGSHVMFLERCLIL